MTLEAFLRSLDLEALGDRRPEAADDRPMQEKTSAVELNAGPTRPSEWVQNREIVVRRR
jgi:hypothetical protein